MLVSWISSDLRRGGGMVDLVPSGYTQTMYPWSSIILTGRSSVDIVPELFLDSPDLLGSVP